MIFEMSLDNLRDIAAAVNAALKREPSDELRNVEHRVLTAIRTRAEALELEPEEAQTLRQALLRRAYIQRDNSEGWDYSDLADRIDRALQDASVPIEEITDPS